MSTILTLGTFDLFHRGHVELLRRCAERPGPPVVVVGLNTDAFVERYRGRPPVVGYEDRAAVLRACRYVDRVFPNEQADGTILDVLGLVQPDVIVVGDDWQARDYLGQVGLTHDDLRRFNTRVEYVPYTQGISSTAIKERMA